MFDDLGSVGLIVLGALIVAGGAEVVRRRIRAR
jgi:hypothetical protein